jgi:membrane-bound lytic murein transglycosylase F
VSANRTTTSVLLACLLFLWTAACGEREEGLVSLVRPGPVDRDLEDLREESVLRVLVTTDSTSYFLYRGTPMGYDYGLLKRFANQHELALEVVLVRDREELVERLDRGDGDVGAARLIPDYDAGSGPAWTLALYETPPALVQREGPPLGTPPIVAETLEEGPPSDRAFDPERIGMEPREIRARLLRRRSEVAGEAVAVPDHSEYSERALELFDVEGDEVEVVEVEDVASYETLIRQVARGEVRLAASPRNLAALTESYFTNVVVYPTLGPTHPTAWAVRRNAPDLLAALNAFLAQDGELPRYDELYAKYFVDRQGYREREESEYLTSVTGRLSAYDDLLRQQAAQLGWDWRASTRRRRAGPAPAASCS